MRSTLSTTLCAFAIGTHAFPATIYVDATAPASGDGTTWAAAYNDLQDALTDARTLRNVDSIHIAEGTYLPDGRTVDQTISFELVEGVVLLGGFPNGGGSLEDRDPDLHVTVLSGDLLGDDGELGFLHQIPNSGENSLHVVRALSAGRSTELNGVTIRSGRADQGFGTDGNGGCVLIEGGGPVIRDCIIELGAGDSGGGGLASIDSDVLIDNCTFRFNRSADFGGGAAIMGECSAKVRNCLFEDNLGGSGVGVYCGPQQILGRPDFTLNQCLITDCQFIENTGQISANSGGGILLNRSTGIVQNCSFIDNLVNGGGGMYVRQGTAIIDQCMFLGNVGKGDGGGAVYVEDFTGDSNAPPTRILNCLMARNSGAVIAVDLAIEVINCTVVDNKREPDDFALAFPAFLSQHAPMTIRNSIIWDNLDQDEDDDSADDFLVQFGDGFYTISDCIIEHWDGSIDGTAVSDDPLLIDIDGPDDDPFATGDNDYHIMPLSPAIDAGDNDALPFESDTDLDGLARYVDGDDDGFIMIDIGAYELQAPAAIGDVDGDGAVGPADLAIVLGAWGRCTGNCPGDFDDNGIVDAADLALLLGNWSS